MLDIIGTQMIFASRPEFSRFGQGQYFTDISPEVASQGAARDMSRALYERPYVVGKVRAFVAVDVTDIPVDRAANIHTNDSFSSDFGIYLHRSDSALSIVGRVRRAGPVAYAREGE